MPVTPGFAPGPMQQSTGYAASAAMQRPVKRPVTIQSPPDQQRDAFPPPQQVAPPAVLPESPRPLILQRECSVHCPSPATHCLAVACHLSNQCDNCSFGLQKEYLLSQEFTGEAGFQGHNSAPAAARGRGGRRYSAMSGSVFTS